MAESVPITVGEPEVSQRQGRSTWTVPVAGPSGMPDTIWYEVPAAYQDWLTDRADPALIALTIPAMRLGVPIICEGPVSDELAFFYPDIQSLYSATGDRPPVGVQFNDKRPALAGGIAVAAGFSGGIDSFALLAEHHYPADVPEPQRLTHLLFNNVGSHGHGGESTWRRRFERLAPTAEKIGLPFIDINSNLDQIPAPGVNYEHLNSPANASVAHLLAGGLQRWIFASSAEFRRVGVTPRAYNTAFVDTIALPLMSTSGFSLQTSSSRMRRIDKTRVVADIPDAWTSLDVCISGDPAASPANCSTCWKCQLTLAALDLIGVEDRFAPQFDLSLWRAERDDYLAKIPFTKKPALVGELNELMAETGHVVPRADRRRAAQQLATARARDETVRVARRGRNLARRLARQGISGIRRRP